jgi:serine/threonine-protein kinase
MGGRHCETERTVTFTRTGDADLSSLPNPGNQRARVASPAAAWHGRYHGTATPNTNRAASSWDSTFLTDCLRSGERCVTYSTNENGFDIQIFADNKWVFNFDGNSNCAAGGTAPTKINWEFPLPEPPQDPITLITGRGHREITGGGCAGAYDEDVKYDRTGN